MARTLDRFIATCKVDGCLFDRREAPALHAKKSAAESEAKDHAMTKHVGTKAVTVERTYAVASEKIVG